MASDNNDIRWNANAKVLKYSPEQVSLSRSLLGHEPDGAELAVHHAEPADGIATEDGNLLTTAGLTRITSLIIGGGGQAASNGAAGLGVGDQTTAAAIGDTRLTADTGTLGNSRYIPATATYPSAAAGVITVSCTFGTSDANYAWNEWGLCVAASFVASNTFAATGTSPVLINHKAPAALGTKASGSSWVFVATITLA